jgi:hypothetical protein
MGGEFSMHGGIIKAFKILVGKPEGKYHWEDLCEDWRIILNGS